MKARVAYFVLISCSLLLAAPSVGLAGVEGGTPGVVPEPTAMLVWLGLAGAGGLFFWRRGRDIE